MKNDITKKIKWLLGFSGITTYKISKEIGESTQFLDRYKNDPQKIGGMRLEKAEKLIDYIDRLDKTMILSPKMNNQQILIQGATEEEINSFFEKFPFAVKLNWIKPYKEMFIVNFDTSSNKSFKKFPYFLENLYFFQEVNKKNMEKLAYYLKFFGKEINFGGSRKLYKLDGKSYQVVIDIRKPQDAAILGAVKIINVVETETFRDDLYPKISDEDIILTKEDL